jgi:integrase
MIGGREGGRTLGHMLDTAAASRTKLPSQSRLVAAPINPQNPTPLNDQNDTLPLPGILRMITSDAAGIAEERKGWLFRTSPRHTATVLTEQPMAQADAWRMIRRRAVAAGIHAPIGNHTFRATGITAYLGNGGALEHAQSMAAHESPRTTKLYDRTQERLTQMR